MDIPIPLYLNMTNSPPESLLKQRRYSISARHDNFSAIYESHSAADGQNFTLYAVFILSREKIITTGSPHRLRDLSGISGTYGAQAYEEEKEIWWGLLGQYHYFIASFMLR